MKILISDYPEELNRNLAYEKELFLHQLPIQESDIEIYPYKNESEFLEHVKDADALLTAFLPLGESVFSKCEKLKCIGINATGYGTVDMKAAEKYNIAVCPVLEYCTSEVAEHTLALMSALFRNLKTYMEKVEQEHIWSYQSAGPNQRMAGKTLAVFGLGRIGRAVAKRAQAFDMKVIGVDLYFPKEEAEKLGVTLVDKEYALKHADVITNHMNQTKENELYFSWTEFEKMKQKPFFLNVGRGSAVSEEALVHALDTGKIRGAALDVLKSEAPELEENPLLGRENVILTPHAAFYSETSMQELQRITCENIIFFFQGEYEKIQFLANPIVLERVMEK